MRPGHDVQASPDRRFAGDCGFPKLDDDRRDTIERNVAAVEAVAERDGAGGSTTGCSRRW